jgi:hypothetical protein
MCLLIPGKSERTEVLRREIDFPQMIHTANCQFRFGVYGVVAFAGVGQLGLGGVRWRNKGPG